MTSTSKTTDRAPVSMEIISTRLFDAPRERVFDAFANPSHLLHWWGPKGFSNTIKEFDLRPGGAWHLIMHGPDGTTYDNSKRFIEVVRPERIVYEHLQPMHHFEMTMLYKEVGAQTELTWRMVFEPAAENEQLRNYIIEANEQNFDRLATYLKTSHAAR